MSDTPSDVPKRILFISFALGLMFALGALLLYRAIVTDKPALIAIVIPLFITAIPFIRTLRELRRTQAKNPPTV